MLLKLVEGYWNSDNDDIVVRGCVDWIIAQCKYDAEQGHTYKILHDNAVKAPRLLFCDVDELTSDQNLRTSVRYAKVVLALEASGISINMFRIESRWNAGIPKYKVEWSKNDECL